MPSNQESRREYITIVAIDPIYGKPCEVLISYDRIQAVGREVLVTPKNVHISFRLFCNILRPFLKVFGGTRTNPAKALAGDVTAAFRNKSFLQDGTPIRPYAGQIYLVFVNDENVAYNWRWEKSDESDLRLPRDHDTRFRRRLL